MKKTIALSLVFLFLAAGLVQADEKKLANAAFWTLSVSYVVGSAADVISTIHGISRHGLRESNSFMRPWLYQKKYGLVWAGEILVTGATVAGLRYVFSRRPLICKVGVIAVLIGGNYLRWAAVVHNCKLNRGRP